MMIGRLNIQGTGMTAAPYSLNLLQKTPKHNFFSLKKRPITNH